jgi:hypothetical protein
MSETTASTLSTSSATSHTLPKLFKPQSLAEFMSKTLPSKEPLIDGLLYRRDAVTLVARRRAGKTTLSSYQAIQTTTGQSEFIGYSIPKKLRITFLYLEDDPTEIQEKLSRQLAGRETPEGFHLYTRHDLRQLGIPMDIMHPVFQDFIRLACEKAEADVLYLDNLGKLIGADYNNAQKIEKLVNLINRIQDEYNTAVVTLAHPRKVGGKDDKPVSLVQSPGQFFEECLGSSHWINSNGSLWGMERNEEDVTTFLGGAQRYQGDQSATELTKTDEDHFFVSFNYEKNLRLATTTPMRRAAWGLVPDGQEFTFIEFYKTVQPVMSTKSAVWNWFQKSLLRLGLIVETKPGSKSYRKAKPPAGPGIAINRVLEALR